MEPLVVFTQPGNSSNESGFCLGETQHVSITVLMCLVFFLSFLLNTFSLWVFCCRLQCWTSGSTLQFHLILSDAITTPVTPMTAVYFAMGNDWPFGQFLCQVKIALLSSHFYGSNLFLTLISIHRYTAVVNFNRSSCMKHKEFVRKLCAGVWSLLLIQALIYTFKLPPSKEANNSQCLSIHQKNLTDAYFVNFLLFIFEFPCVSCLAYTVVLKKYYPRRCHVFLQIETVYYASWILAGVNSCLIHCCTVLVHKTFEMHSNLSGLGREMVQTEAIQKSCTLT